MTWFDFSTVVIDVTLGAVRARRDTSITAVHASTGAALNLRQGGDPVTELTSDPDGVLEFQAEDPALPAITPTVRLTMLGQSVVVESLQQKVAKAQFAGDLNAAVVSALNTKVGNGEILAPSSRGVAGGVASLDAATKVPVAQVPALAASKTTSGTFDAARIPDLRARDGLFFGTDGRKYRLIAGTIRNAGAGWFVLDDASHRNTGITGISETSGAITIATETGTRVVSLTATPDETYAARGILAGTTVSLSSTSILLYDGGDGLGDYVSWNGSAFVSVNGVFTINSYTGGVLTLGHASISGTRASATRRGAGFHPSVGQVGATTTQVLFYSTANPNVLATTGDAAMQVYVNRFGRYARAPIDPSMLTEANGNIWITGVLEVA